MITVSVNDLQPDRPTPSWWLCQPVYFIHNKAFQITIFNSSCFTFLYLQVSRMRSVFRVRIIAKNDSKPVFTKGFPCLSCPISIILGVMCTCDTSLLYRNLETRFNVWVSLSMQCNCYKNILLGNSQVIRLQNDKQECCTGGKTKKERLMMWMSF